ncbi:hypothetical protein CTA1_13049 [Colletotrichum tanaceti]|uniref:Uncharacterized protein n=1 Tax=Colletotrichum tanaceti TaxID=1306861 RepID=A0A4U6XMQ4_9PEZI|nr:hypothetical protein CTA1_13049 [Colletotrichum tanaceti]
MGQSSLKHSSSARRTTEVATVDIVRDYGAMEREKSSGKTRQTSVYAPEASAAIVALGELPHFHGQPHRGRQRTGIGPNSPEAPTKNSADTTTEASPVRLGKKRLAIEAEVEARTTRHKRTKTLNAVAASSSAPATDIAKPSIARGAPLSGISDDLQRPVVQEMHRKFVQRLESLGHLVVVKNNVRQVIELNAEKIEKLGRMFFSTFISNLKVNVVNSVERFKSHQHSSMFGNIAADDEKPALIKELASVLLTIATAQTSASSVTYSYSLVQACLH